MTNDIWTWQPGNVDLQKRYFELKYGYDPKPVALIGVGNKYNFIVEFLLDTNKEPDTLKEIFSEVIWEIELYLVNNSEPDPVEFMINHTKKCANQFSKVHWRYYPKGFKHPILLSKKDNFPGKVFRFFLDLIKS